MHDCLGFESERYAHLPFCFFLVHTGIYQDVPGLSEYHILVYTQYIPILHVCIGIYWYIPLCTMFVSVYTVIFQYVPGLSQYIQVCTCFVLELTSLGYYLVHSGTLNCLLNTYF